MATDEEIRSSRSMERSGCASARSTSMPLGPGLDQRLLTLGHHQLVAQLRRELAQEQEGDHHHPQAHQTRDHELVLPGLEMRQGVGGHRGWPPGSPWSGPSAQKPMATPRPICGEKSRMSAGVETRITPSTNPMTQ